MPKLRNIPRDVSRRVRTRLQAGWRRLLPIGLGKPHALPGKLVVSLTSYPPRFATLDLTLRALVNQDTAPDVLVLWIAHQDVGKLPARVRRLERYGFVIRECDDWKTLQEDHPGADGLPRR